MKARLGKRFLFRFYISRFLLRFARRLIGFGCLDFLFVAVYCRGAIGVDAPGVPDAVIPCGHVGHHHAPHAVGVLALKIVQFESPPQIWAAAHAVEEDQLRPIRRLERQLEISVEIMSDIDGHTDDPDRILTGNVKLVFYAQGIGVGNRMRQVDGNGFSLLFGLSRFIPVRFLLLLFFAFLRRILFVVRVVTVEAVQLIRIVFVFVPIRMRQRRTGCALAITDHARNGAEAPVVCRREFTEVAAIGIRHTVDLEKGAFRIVGTLEVGLYVRAVRRRCFLLLPFRLVAVYRRSVGKALAIDAFAEFQARRAGRAFVL